MSFFSRLSDIVSCNVRELTRGSADAPGALRQVIQEMEQGVAGAKRSLAAALNNERRLEQEVTDSRSQIAEWVARAKTALGAGRDDVARTAVTRKKELEDLLRGLEQQHAAAVATREQLSTTFWAVEARLAEARRALAELESTASPSPPVGAEFDAPRLFASPHEDGQRAAEIDAELAALRRELLGDQ